MSPQDAAQSADTHANSGIPQPYGRLRELAQHWSDRALACGNPQCSPARRAWRRFSRTAGTVLLQGRRYCFPDCFEIELRTMFERLQSPPLQRGPASRRIPLGLLMLSRGDLTSAQLRTALETRQGEKLLRIGDCLQRLGFADERQITAALAIQWSCPVLKSIPAALRTYDIPVHLLTRRAMLPIQMVPSTRTLHIAFASEVHYPALVAVEQMLECRTEPCLATPSQITQALNELANESRASEKVFPGLQTAEEATAIAANYAARMRVTDARLASCGDLVWVRVCGERGAMNLMFSLAGSKAEITSDVGRLKSASGTAQNFQ